MRIPRLASTSFATKSHRNSISGTYAHVNGNSNLLAQKPPSVVVYSRGKKANAPRRRGLRWAGDRTGPASHHPDEPTYNGRSLSTWVRVYRDYSAGADLPETELDGAKQAIRAIGTNALPFLLKWIQQEPPSWHRGAHTRLPQLLSDNAPAKLLFDGPGYETANAAMLAFGILGTNAGPAIPELVALMNATNNQATVNRAMVAMAFMGAPAFLHLAAALSNTNQLGRRMIPYYIRAMAALVGTNVCLPPLKTALQDPDPAVRTAASNALRVLAPSPVTNAPAQ